MITTAVTKMVDNSRFMGEFCHFLQHEFKVDVDRNICKKKDYTRIWKGSHDFITWGMKWKSRDYKKGGRNVLFLENAYLKQGHGVQADTYGYFSDSSIVKNKEYNIEPSKAERAQLRTHIKRHYFGHVFGDYSYDPEGPILIPLQMNGDATMLHYFPLCDTDKRSAKHLQLCIDNLPVTVDALIRNHPREKTFPDVKLPRHFSIDNSGKIHERLKKCSGVIAVNSTVVTEALIFGLPVATLGRSIFYKSKCVIDCSKDPSKIKDVRNFKPDMEDIERFLCAVFRRQIAYDSPIEKTLKNPAIKDWLDVVAKNKNKVFVHLDKIKGKPIVKNKSEIVMNNSGFVNLSKIEQKKEEPIPQAKKRKTRKRNATIETKEEKNVEIKHLYDLAIIGHDRSGRKYLGSIIKNHPQVDPSRVAILDIDDEIDFVINDDHCKTFLIYKEDLFEAYLKHYIYKKYFGIVNSKNNTRLKVDEYNCMRWMIETRERIKELKEKVNYSLPFNELTQEKINDLFNIWDNMPLLGFSPGTKKCPVKSKSVIRNYDVVKNKIIAQVGLEFDSELTVSNSSITKCIRCKNETIDKASDLNRCTFCGHRNK